LRVEVAEAEDERGILVRVRELLEDADRFLAASLRLIALDQSERSGTRTPFDGDLQVLGHADHDAAAREVLRHQLVRQLDLGGNDLLEYGIALSSSPVVAPTIPASKSSASTLPLSSLALALSNSLRASSVSPFAYAWNA
jgi:hypothetical protein